MAVRAHLTKHKRLTEADLAPWRRIPTVMASDCRPNPEESRGGAMAGRIGPVDPSFAPKGETLVGQACTADCPLGDQSAVKAAIAWAQTGDIVVADAKACADIAMVGDIVALWAREVGVSGLVIDGAIRDLSQMVDVGLPTFAMNAVPRRPRAEHRGSVNGPISCGGVMVHPGDLVLADRDGVVVVPLEDVDATLIACQEKLEYEEVIIAALKRGELLPDITPAIQIEPA